MKEITYAERIKELRVEDGLSQSELSRRTGLSQAAIALWESGDRVPNAISIIKLANFFEVSSDYILGLSDVWRQRS